MSIQMDEGMAESTAEHELLDGGSSHHLAAESLRSITQDSVDETMPTMSPKAQQENMVPALDNHAPSTSPPTTPQDTTNNSVTASAPASPMDTTSTATTASPAATTPVGSTNDSSIASPAAPKESMNEADSAGPVVLQNGTSESKTLSPAPEDNMVECSTEGPPSKRQRTTYETSPDQNTLPSYDPAMRTELTFEDVINQEQEDLLDDKRTQALLHRFRDVQSTWPPTYYSNMAPIGIHILGKGQPAQTNEDDRVADFLVGNSRRLEDWLMNGTGDKMFVLRDEDWFHTRPSLSGSEMFDELITKSVSKTLQLEVQELGKVIEDDSRSVGPMAIDEIRTRWQDKSRPPLNLLNLMCKDDAYQPWPLAKHCNLLNKAAASAAATAQSALGYVTAGKESKDTITKYKDLESCMHFQIYGQAGAISTWHMDAIGPYTYVTLEPNEAGQQADEVLKLWAFVRTDHLPKAEQDKIRRDFQRDNEGYMPNPEHIRILALTARDTLIMPPGTIHAPITVTDCLFRGGMVMQKRQMPKSMREWRFCVDNGFCTNEEQPKQSRSILDYFKQEVDANPEACGYGEPSGVARFYKDYDRISGSCLVCNCSGGCTSTRCGCRSNAQRCGNLCHGGIARCENPYGCDVGLSSEQLRDAEHIFVAEQDSNSEGELTGMGNASVVGRFPVNPAQRANLLPLTPSALSSSRKDTPNSTSKAKIIRLSDNEITEIRRYAVENPSQTQPAIAAWFCSLTSKKMGQWRISATLNDPKYAHLDEKPEWRTALALRSTLAAKRNRSQGKLKSREFVVMDSSEDDGVEEPVKNTDGLEKEGPSTHYYSRNVTPNSTPNATKLHSDKRRDIRQYATANPLTSKQEIMAWFNAKTPGEKIDLTVVTKTLGSGYAYLDKRPKLGSAMKGRRSNEKKSAALPPALTTGDDNRPLVLDEDDDDDTIEFEPPKKSAAQRVSSSRKVTPKMTRTPQHTPFSALSDDDLRKIRRYAAKNLKQSQAAIAQWFSSETPHDINRNHVGSALKEIYAHLDEDIQLTSTITSRLKKTPSTTFLAVDHETENEAALEEKTSSLKRRLTSKAAPLTTSCSLYDLSDDHIRDIRRYAVHNVSQSLAVIADWFRAQTSLFINYRQVRTALHQKYAPLDDDSQWSSIIGSRSMGRTTTSLRRCTGQELPGLSSAADKDEELGSVAPSPETLDLAEKIYTAEKTVVAETSTPSENEVPSTIEEVPLTDVTASASNDSSADGASLPERVHLTVGAITAEEFLQAEEHTIVISEPLQLDIASPDMTLSSLDEVGFHELDFADLCDSSTKKSRSADQDDGDFRPSGDRMPSRQKKKTLKRKTPSVAQRLDSEDTASSGEQNSAAKKQRPLLDEVKDLEGASRSEDVSPAKRRCWTLKVPTYYEGADAFSDEEDDSVQVASPAWNRGVIAKPPQSKGKAKERKESTE